MTMPGWLSAILSRVIAAAFAGFCTWLLSKWGVLIDAETQQKAVEVVVSVIVAIYAIVHKLIDAKLNPTDAAAPDVVESDKRSVRSRRLSRTL